MYHFKIAYRNLRRNGAYSVVNIVGLSVVFACLLLSVSYIKRELSYDRHNTNVDRIVRLSLQFDNEPVDVRVYGNNLNAVLQQLPEIERKARMFRLNSAMLTYDGRRVIINDFYHVNSDFLHVFDIPLLYGEKEEVLKRTGQALVSESFARQLFGDIDNGAFQTSAIYLDGWNIKDTVFVSGIFKDIPETSHFQTDILLYLPDGEYSTFIYTYLLLKHQTDIKALENKITKFIEENELYQSSTTRVILMPLADIHLHSHSLREMSVNGNIHYIYLIVGANVLLMIVVMFNLWLNASLVFARNRRYYQFVRLHGAPSSTVFKDEALAALLLGIFSIAVGTLTAFYILSLGKMPAQISFFELGVLCPAFLLLIIAISLLPALKGMAYTLFFNTDHDLRPMKFSYSNVKYMLTAQYAVVMMVVILAFGINKQMNLVKETQVGGNEQNILVMQQPTPMKPRYPLLKSELLRHPEIESVTASFQLPGEAICDGIHVKKEDETDWRWLPLILAGEDFLPFFRIKTIAGRGFNPNKYDYQTEETIFHDYIYYEKSSEHVEEYVINRKALAVLGFNTPEEALGQTLQISHGTIDYFHRGVIVGVTNDFNYTGLYEETQPLLILQRNMILHCMMVRLDPDRFQQAQTVFDKVWNEVNPDYPADYLFMNDVFGRMYRNEMNAQQLIYIFSLLCLVIADLGLITFMAFIIRRRTKEIGIRKVCGATVGEIIRMLNMGFIRYVALAFIIAVPVAWYIMQRWLERFAYKTSLDWWIFILAGLTVLLVSVASVSLQSWRAATTDPVRAIMSCE
jgi:putative ABC transport system permease protein